MTFSHKCYSTVTKQFGKNGLPVAFVAKNHSFINFCQFRSTLDGCLQCYNQNCCKRNLERTDTKNKVK